MNEYVFLLRGPRGLARLRVQGTFLVLGRTSTIPLLRADRTISREHAVLVASPSGIRIKDLGSSNGIQIEGKTLAAYAEVALEPGARVSFGSTVLVLLTQREASKRLDQEVDEVVIDAEGSTQVIRAKRAPSPTEADTQPAQPEGDRESENSVDEVILEPEHEQDALAADDELAGIETEDALEPEEDDLEPDSAPDAWIEDALVPEEEAEDAEPIRSPGKVTELDAEVTELELHTELELDADGPDVSRDAMTELSIENVLERGGEETADPEDLKRWNEIEQELADLDRREPNLE